VEPVSLVLRPGTLDDVIELKVWVATLVLALAAVQLVSMVVVYGWVPFPERYRGPLAVFHRWDGRVTVFVAAVIAVLCIIDPGPQSSPDRRQLHTIFGSLVVVLVLAKVTVIHAVPKAGPLIPVLGVVLAASFAMLWYTSSYAFWFGSGSGYSGHAEVDAVVSIVADPETTGAYAPAEVHVQKGHAIEWRNDHEGVPHTVTGGKFDSGPRGLSTGDTFKWQFNAAGRVEYRCTIHPAMKGTVIVDP
jgi:plastocyanin